MTSASRATHREWIGLAVIALPCLLYSMDLTVLNLALPAIRADLDPTSAQLLWIVDVYGFLVAGSLITMGSLGDRVGRRRMLLIGAGVFGAASVFAAFSTSAAMLIAARALLGVAGATVAPSTLSLIRNMFQDPAQRTVAVSVWIMSYSLGGAVGPLVGGLLLTWFWWGSVFLIAVPVMLLLLAVGPTLLPEYRDPNAGRADLPSAALSLGAVLAMIFGLKQAAQDGIGWLPVLSVLAGLALGAAFVRRSRRLADPLIDLSLFRIPAFSASLVIYMLGTFVAFGIWLFVAQYLQVVLGMAPLEAGLWTIPFAAGFIVGTVALPAIVRRVRPTYVMAAGLLLAALGYAVLIQAGPALGLPALIAGMVLQSIGLSPVFTLTNDFIIGAAPPERAGAASGISETCSELGGALGIALLGSLATALYGSAVAPESLGRTIQLTAALCAVIALAMAAGTAMLRRNVRPAS